MDDAILSRVTFPLSIYGFSLGGALGILAHEAARYKFPGARVETCAVAAPRVVQAPGARFTGVRRVVLAGDIVPHVPPAWMGYSHVGDVRTYRANALWKHDWRVYDDAIKEL